jgi:hypothetical protein
VVPPTVAIVNPDTSTARVATAALVRAAVAIKEVRAVFTTGPTDGAHHERAARPSSTSPDDVSSVATSLSAVDYPLWPIVTCTP